jgi:hypothetical protein
MIFAFAAPDDSDAQGLWGLGLFASWYGLFCHSIARTARTIGIPRRWRAWVPIFQLTVMADLAAVSQLWAVGMMIPLFGLFVHAATWYRILPRVGMSSTWALVMWVPFFNAPLLAYIGGHLRRAPGRILPL